ncbi:HAD-IA family hydrolase [Dactylosporangium sp. NPDC000244]|uniref:HAD family hydrolase n=1 Tax=Dactylosporangium sp. NPDC000244 TaxID=3154365 RepID=UPI0033177207
MTAPIEPPPSGIIFDLDGTLVDSLDLHRRALGAAAAAAGRAEPSAARVFMAQRATDIGTVAALVGDADLGTAWRAYHDAFLELMPGSGLRPTVRTPDVLRRLGEAGIAVGICTGRTRELAAALLRYCGLDLDLTVAREDVTAPKPAPDGLRLAVDRLGLDPESTLFVGDSAADRSAGEACGIRTVLVPVAAVPGLVWPQLVWP